MHKSTRALPALAIAAALAVAALSPRAAEAQVYGEGYIFGIGGILGQPTGLSMKFLLGAGHGIQAAFAVDLVWRDGFVTYADWVWHPMIITSNSAFDLSFHVGAGLFLAMWFDRYWDHSCHWDEVHHHYTNCDDHEVGLGAHFPVGMDMFFKGAPVELYLELSPGFYFLPFIDFEIFGGVGARYFF